MLFSEILSSGFHPFWTVIFLLSCGVHADHDFDTSACWLQSVDQWCYSKRKSALTPFFFSYAWFCGRVCRDWATSISRKQPPTHWWSHHWFKSVSCAFEEDSSFIVLKWPFWCRPDYFHVNEAFTIHTCPSHQGHSSRSWSLGSKDVCPVIQPKVFKRWSLIYMVSSKITLKVGK